MTIREVEDWLDYCENHPGSLLSNRGGLSWILVGATLHLQDWLYVKVSNCSVPNVQWSSSSKATAVSSLAQKPVRRHLRSSFESNRRRFRL